MQRCEIAAFGATYLPPLHQCGPEQFCEPLVSKELSLGSLWPVGNRSNSVFDIPDLAFEYSALTPYCPSDSAS